MHASSSYQNSGSKVTKIAIVTALHVVLGLALVNMKVIRDAVEDKPAITVSLTPPPAIVEPIVDYATPTEAPPTIFVPYTDIATTTPPEAPTATATIAVPVTPPPPTTGTGISVPPTPALATEVAPVAQKVFEVASAGNCPVPNYPANAARNGDTGTVGLALLIAADGRVADSRVTSSSGFRELDRAAVAALSSCKFQPAKTNGVPEAAWGKIAYVWTLE